MITVYGMSKGMSKMKDLPRAAGVEVQDIMISYYYLPKKKSLKAYLGQYADSVRSGKLRVWIDSGAYSAFKKGIKINIHDYIDYLHTNHEYIYKAIALDEIMSEQKSVLNYLYMRAKGIECSPVFHRFDSLDTLDTYARQTDYIFLGTRAPFDNDDQRREWLDKIFKRYPGKKYHCLGLIQGELLNEYDFESCDSCTWEIPAAVQVV